MRSFLFRIWYDLLVADQQKQNGLTQRQQRKQRNCPLFLCFLCFLCVRLVVSMLAKRIHLSHYAAGTGSVAQALHRSAAPIS
jgi:hypothetical protein